MSDEMKTNKMAEQEHLARLHTLQMVRNSIVSRMAMLNRGQGVTHNGERDVWRACGYPKEIRYIDYHNRYTRQDVAGRIVDAYPDACWEEMPNLTLEIEDEPLETGEVHPFAKKWNDMVDNLHLQSYFNRVDKLSRIGHYAILFLGFDDITDIKDLKKPVSDTASELLFVKPFGEERAVIDTYNSDPTNERYGKPETYQISFSMPSSVNTPQGQTVSNTTENTYVVHWTRVLHLAEGTLEDDYIGRPALKRVYNRLIDLEKVTGGSAEMFWHGAFPLMTFDADPDVTIDEDAKKQMKEDIDKMIHGLSRYIRLQGVKAHRLDATAASPKEHADLQIHLISGATGIPSRILTGSERGELASMQDNMNWSNRVSERRQNYCTPMFIRGLIDRLIFVGVMDDRDYQVIWPKSVQMGEKERAEVVGLLFKSLKDYVDSMGADSVLPVSEAIKLIFNLTDKEVAKIEKKLGGFEVDDDEEADAATVAAQEQEDASDADDTEA